MLRIRRSPAGFSRSSPRLNCIRFESRLCRIPPNRSSLAPRLENPKRGCCYQYRMSASFLSSTQLYPVRITALQNVATYWFNTSSQARLQKSVPGDTSCYLSQITAHYWCRPQLLVTSTEHGYITATEITDSYFLCVSNLFASPRAFCNDTDSRS